MDISFLLRHIGYDNNIDPRTILIPLIDDREGSIIKWTTEYDGIYMDYNALARAWVEAHDEDIDGNYIQAAVDEFDTYVSFYSGYSMYLIYLSRALLEAGVSASVVAEALSDYSLSATGIRTRWTEDSVLGEVRNLVSGENEKSAENSDYYINRIFPIMKQYDKIKPLESISSSLVATTIVADVLIDDNILTTGSINMLMDRIELNERVTYATKRQSGDNSYQVLLGSDLEVTMPQTKREDELLLVITTRGHKNREVIINGKNSTISADNINDIELIVQAIPGLVKKQNKTSSSSATVSFSYMDIQPPLLYYLVQQVEPMKTLMGVDDSQYKRKGLRNLYFRYNRWPLSGAVGVEREKIISIIPSLEWMASRGELMKTLSFSAKDVNSAEVAMMKNLLSRLLPSYSQQEKALMKIYMPWPQEILDPFVLANVKKGRELALIRPNIFGGDYQRRCDKKPILASKDDEGAVEVDGIYVKCTDQKTTLEIREEGGLVIPCCISTNKRAIINPQVELDEDKIAFVYGVAHLFGEKEKHRKGSSKVTRVGVGHYLKKALNVAFKTKSSLMRKLKQIIRGKNMTYAPFLQSMWNFSEEEIDAYMKAEEWDSDKVIDGIALMCGINIFVLEYVNDKVTLRSPSYKFAYYLPFYYDRPCVILYRHSGVVSAGYELVKVTGTTEYLHQDKVSAACIQFFQDRHRTELLDRDGNYSSLQDAGPYIGEDKEDIQIIDSNGKLRGYIRDKIAYYNEHPSSPLNGPYARRCNEEANREVYIGRRREEVVPDEEWKNIAMGSSLVGLPVRRYTEQGMIRLSWDIDRVKQYATHDRTRLYILQLTNWLYSNLSVGIGDIPGLTLEEFSLMMTWEDGKTYEFDILPSDLGVYSGLDALEYLEGTGFTDASELKIIYPSEGVMRGVMQMLKIEERTKNGNSPIPDRLVLLDYNRLRSRLAGNKLYQQVYLRDDDAFDKWKMSYRDYRNQSADDLNDPRMRTYRYPFTIVSTGKVRQSERWLVQNVQNGNYLRALQCVGQWLKNGKNTGYFTDRVRDDPEQMLKYTTIYSWDETRLLTPNVEVQGTTFTLLVYPGYKRTGDTILGYFAALLPLTSS
jgi:hypothetical protein